MSRSISTVAPASAAAALLLLLPSVAGAVGGTREDFRLGPSAHDGQGAVQLVHPDVGGKGAGYVGAVGTTGELFSDPLGYRRLAGLHVGGGFAFTDWLRAELDLPFVAGFADDSSIGSGLGAAQFSLGVPFIRSANGRFAVGISPFVQAPALAGFDDTGVEGGALLALGGGIPGGGWRINGGLRTGPEEASSIDLGAGINGRITTGVGIGAELMTSRSLSATPAGTAPLADPVEATAYVIVGQDRPQSVTIGLTTGLVGAAGSPLYRVTVGLSGRRSGVVGDPDGDGIYGLDDECPESPEDFDERPGEEVDGCYDPDNDLDGIPDGLDRCPDEAEDEDGYMDRDGCPDDDNDYDGVFDEDDACPDTPGPVAAAGCPDVDGDTVGDPFDECPTRPGPVASFGCPDRDGDRVPDYRDQCPGEAISPKMDPVESNGCPVRAFYAAGRIEITERVNFDFGSARVSDSSKPLLMAVAKAINNNPELKRIEVRGHTDDVGTARYNLGLSRRRAAAVRSFLIREGGVSSRRLRSRGYGEGQPIDTNETDAGRYNNRRVEFVVTELK
jgi:outer membrane protein OmpA-like peptidoglycan-associated protein